MSSSVTLDISCNQVREVINSLFNFILGDGELPPFKANTCKEGTIEPITDLINESLNSRIVPSELKPAKCYLFFKFWHT